MTVTQRIQSCLWFDSEAEEAARYYVGIFRNSRILRITDGVMRHIAVRRIEGSRPPAAPPADAVPQPDYAAANVRSQEEE